MRISIFTKLIGMTIFTVLLTSIAIYFTTNYYVTRGFNEKAREELSNTRGAVESEIKDWENTLSNVGFLMASNFEVQHAIEDSNTAFLRRYTQDVMRQTGVQFITISNNAGDVVARGHSEQSGDSVANHLIETSNDKMFLNFKGLF